MRGKGEGSVSRSPDGSGWIARIDLPPVNGKRRRKKKRAKTRAEAVRLLRQMQNELDQYGSTNNAKRTVNDAVDSYLDVRYRDEVSAGTLEDIEWSCRIVAQEIGDIRVSQLSVLDCDEFLERCTSGEGRRNPMSRGRVSRLRRSLIRTLNNEMRTGRLTRNVADLSVLPRSTKRNKEPRALTPSELERLLDLAQNARLIIIDLCGRNGLRPAEARALRWQDVDLDAAELTVCGQQDRHNKRTSVKRAHNAGRTIRLDAQTINRLKIWQETQAELRAKAGPVWQDHDVIASTAFGTAIDRHSLARSMRTISTRLEIKPSITPYDLRHTAISQQADAGRSTWEIADWAGTSEEMISRVYRHRLRRVASLRPVMRP